MTKILICDDRREDLDDIAKIIETYASKSSRSAQPLLYSLARFCDPWAALSYVEVGNAVDIAFLDIMMPQMNGMELATKMRELGFAGYLIFLTSSNDFAAQSYGVKAFSYILKPADDAKVCELLDAIEKTRRDNDHNGFSLTRRSGARFILYAELMYAEVMDHQLHFHLIDGEVISIYAALRDYCDVLLSQPQIIKPHKSFVANLDYVRACENRAILMRDGTRISVPKDFESVKEQWLERLFGRKDW
jgi:DNA-binding LytR/AlgR family response regulator